MNNLDGQVGDFCGTDLNDGYVSSFPTKRDLILAINRAGLSQTSSVGAVCGYCLGGGGGDFTCPVCGKP